MSDEKHIVEQTVKYLCEQSKRPHDEPDTLALKLGHWADRNWDQVEQLR